MERHYWEVPESLVTGAWAEKRRLARALRRLVALCVTTDAPESALRALTRSAEEAVAALDRYPSRTFGEGFSSCRTLDDYAVFTDRALMVGESNPIAPPMRLDFEEGVAVALVTFGAQFEGAPGLVHGGFVAAAFDQILGYLLVRLDKAAMTRTLTVHYERPTPILSELKFDARLDRSEGRRHHVSARLFARGDLTARAEGVFVSLGADDFMRLFDRETRNAVDRK